MFATYSTLSSVMYEALYVPGRAIKKRLGQKKRKSIENGEELLLHPAKPDVKNI